MIVSRKIVALLFLMIFSITANSQGLAPRFGLRAGVLYTDWEGEKVIDDMIAYQGKTGGFIGFYSVWEFSTSFNLEYGLNVSLKGFAMNGQLIIPGVQLAADLKNHSVYIDVPVAIRWLINNDSPAGVFIKGGVQFSYLALNKIEGNVLYNGTNFYGDPESNAEELNRFDISIFPGVGYQFTNGLHFQLLYERGLLNIIKDEDYLGLTNAINSVIKIQIGIDL